MRRLLAPSHVSVSGKLYERAEDGTVEVPDQHAAELIASHGCQDAPAPAVKPATERVQGRKKAE